MINQNTADLGGGLRIHTGSAVLLAEGIHFDVIDNVALSKGGGLSFYGINITIKAKETVQHVYNRLESISNSSSTAEDINEIPSSIDVLAHQILQNAALIGTDASVLLGGSVGCQMKEVCNECKSCLDKPRNGGKGTLHQINV